MGDNMRTEIKHELIYIVDLMHREIDAAICESLDIDLAGGHMDKDPYKVGTARALYSAQVVINKNIKNRTIPQFDPVIGLEAIL